jgi:hypothetical protein
MTVTPFFRLQVDVSDHALRHARHLHFDAQLSVRVATRHRDTAGHFRFARVVDLRQRERIGSSRRRGDAKGEDEDGLPAEAHGSAPNREHSLDVHVTGVWRAQGARR